MKEMSSNQNAMPPALSPEKVLDVRPVPCASKHSTIFKTWLGLPVGDYFVLLNDHDPVPLRYQFLAEFPNAFTWEYLEKGPEVFQVKIAKLKSTQSGQSCDCSEHE